MALKKFFPGERSDKDKEKKESRHHKEKDKHHKHKHQKDNSHKSPVEILDPPESPDDTAQHIQGNPKHMQKLQEIESGLREINLDQTFKQQALDKIAEIRRLMLKPNTQDLISNKIGELDKLVLELRKQAVEAKKEEIYDGVQKVLDRGENISLLQERADHLEALTHTAFQPTQKKKAKKGGFLSFFSCFPCCGGKDDSDKEPERRPLLKK